MLDALARIIAIIIKPLVEFLDLFLNAHHPSHTANEVLEVWYVHAHQQALELAKQLHEEQMYIDELKEDLRMAKLESQMFENSYNTLVECLSDSKEVI